MVTTCTANRQSDLSFSLLACITAILMVTTKQSDLSVSSCMYYCLETYSCQHNATCFETFET
jgi:hypothetical protein